MGLPKTLQGTIEINKIAKLNNNRDNFNFVQNNFDRVCDTYPTFKKTHHYMCV